MGGAELAAAGFFDGGFDFFVGFVVGHVEQHALHEVVETAELATRHLFEALYKVHIEAEHCCCYDNTTLNLHSVVACKQLTINKGDRLKSISLFLYAY